MIKISNNAYASGALATVQLWLRHCISLCDIPCSCALSTSAFIDSSLHQLDLFLEIFYGDLWNDEMFH